MAPLWLTLSALCLVGAAVLLYVDIDKRRGRGRRRRLWAKSYGFDYESESPDLLKRWQRGLMSTVGDVIAKNVVLGQIRGEAVYIFDVEEDATVIALHRKVLTDVVIDLRLKICKEPREDDIWPLGEIGSRVVYSTNLDAARRVCDRRMVAFARSASERFEIMWNEQQWILITMPVTSDRADWDEGLRTVRKFSDLLRVLPPSGRMRTETIDCPAADKKGSDGDRAGAANSSLWGDSHPTGMGMQAPSAFASARLTQTVNGNSEPAARIVSSVSTPPYRPSSHRSHD